MGPFVPAAEATVNINVSASSQRIAFSSLRGPQQVRIFNAGTETAFINFGDGTVAATVGSGIPVPAGALEVLTATGTYMAAIAAGATGVIYATPGAGN